MLPKINSPLIELIIPSTKEKETFRLMTVKEEKLLLIAKESKSMEDILLAIKQVINVCAIRNDFDIDNLTIFDLEFLFIRIRAASVNNVITATYKDNEDDKEYTFEIDLNELEVEFPENVSNVIQVNRQEDMNLVFTYPPAKSLTDKSIDFSNENSFFEMIIRCFITIYDGDTMYDMRNVSKEEKEEFLDGLDVKTFASIQNFFTNTPSLKKVLTYTNTKGKEREIVLSGLADFFI